jgi:hypothetical protein
MLDVGDYGGFLFEHLGHLVGRRFLKREWPQDLAALIRVLDLADLAALALMEPVAADDAVGATAAARADRVLQGRLAARLKAAGARAELLREVSAISFLADWYRLRMGSDLALEWIADGRMALYQAVGRLYAEGDWDGVNAAQARLALIFRMFEKSISGLPSGNFRIDRTTGAIASRASQANAPLERLGTN